jgi:hypothetical protein
LDRCICTCPKDTIKQNGGFLLMSYKFQLGPARLSGSLVQEGDVDLAGGMKISGSLVLGSDRALQNLASVSASAGISGFTGTFEGGLTVGDSQVIDEDRKLKNIASLDATSEATIEAAIDTLASLASMGTSGQELEALGSLDVAEGLKIANTSVISAARAVSNVTSVAMGGALSGVTTAAVSGLASLDGGINTNDDFTVDTDGNVVGVAGTFSGLASLDGGINVNDDFTVNADGAVVAVGINAGGAVSGVTSLDGSGDLTMGTITMTGFTVDADGDTVVKTVSGSGGLSGLSLTIGGAGNRGFDEDGQVSVNQVNVNSGGIVNAGAISGATTISGSSTLAAFSATFEGGLTVGGSQIIDEDKGLKNIASLDATSEATIEAAIDTLANLASMGTSGQELEALGSLDVAEGLKIGNTQVFSAARALSGVTSIDASGDLTVGSITNAEFTVDASGNTDIDGTLNVEGIPTFQAAAVFSSGISNAGAIAAATTISGSGRAQAFDVVAEGGFLVGGNKVIDEDRKLTVLSSSVSTFYGSGNAQFASGVRIEGAALFDGAVTIGNAAGDDLTLLGRVASAIVPKTDSSHNLGSDSHRWDTIYVDNIVGANIVKDVEARAGGQTISAGTEFALITAGDGVTVTLPAASAGKCLHVKLSSSIGDVILAAGAGDLVEAQASIRLESTGSAVNLVAYDAMTWFIV